jgi:maltooligosyltrehalose synthase
MSTAGGQSLYLVVEKILDLTRESLPSDWPAHGTTGYDFANQMVQILTDPGAEKLITRTFERFTGFRESFADLAYEKKVLTMQLSLSSEISALGKALDELSEMYLIQRLLTFRAENRSLFQKGNYKELVVTGEKANHIIAFERRLGAQSLVVAVPRLTHSFGPWPVGDAWDKTFLTGVLHQEAEQWHDVLSQKTIAVSDRIGIPAIFSDLPFAVLHQRGES